MNWFGGGTTNFSDIYINPLNFYYVTWQNFTLNDSFIIGNNVNASTDLTFQITSTADWLSISPQNGSISPGNEVNISITIDTSNLTTGVTSTFITLITNDPDETSIQLPLYISIPSFKLVNLSLYEGWNMITIPVSTGEDLTADSLHSQIPGCGIILRWNASSGDFDLYAPGAPYNFAIENGVGYLVSVEYDTNVEFMGIPLQSVSVPLHIGWNMLGWFKEENTTTSSLLTNITGCNIVLLWNASIADFDVYVPGAEDRIVKPGTGFLVAVTEESEWHGEG